MQIKFSDTLHEAIKKGELNAARFNNGSYILDHAMLQLLKSEGSHVSTILSRILRDWEIFQVKIKIERSIARVSQSGIDISNGLLQSIHSELQGVVETINSGHLLSIMLRDRSFVSTRVFEQYGISETIVGQWVKQLPENENYYDEMRLLSGSTYRIERVAGRLDSPKRTMVEPQVARTTTAVAHKLEVLSRYGVEMTALAMEGKIDDVVGRESEITRLIQILGRRKKNNPVLIGEAGVGKSAIVEGLAIRIADGDVPKRLLNRRLYSLDMTAMVAGTKFRGDFEERMNALIAELRNNPDIIIFIDEIHTIVGSGSSQGSLDTANILKPSLARGELQCIGATTYDEYRETIESDGALERRFQKIIVEPTTIEQTLEIMNRVAPHYERHHSVRYTEQAKQACVQYAERYLTDRSFPDKAIDLMDEAGAKAFVASGEIPDITHDHIAEVVSLSTGIPLSRLSSSEQSRLAEMEQSLHSVVVGQESAVAKVSRAIQRSRTGLKDPNRPIGVFMFVGPTGVGKTLLAKELALMMFDSNRSIIRIDMSEYAEKHNVSRLIGSPPGYVGHGDGGQLTERVRRHPYSVVLFDEIEKAHPDINNIMLQIFDDGHLTDGLGRRVDFRNTVIIMTSNVGSREVLTARNPVGYGASEESDHKNITREQLYRKALERTFAPEFINRIDDIVIFNTLSKQEVYSIIEIELSKLSQRILELGYGIEINDCVKHRLIEHGYLPQYGVRSLKRTILEMVEEPIAELIIEGKLQKGLTANVKCVDEQICFNVA